jgi:hypothetical protein
MHFSFIHPFKLNLRDGHTQVAEFTLHEPLHDTSEGSEFLDDALRMEDLSITSYANTEETLLREVFQTCSSTSKMSTRDTSH